MSEHMSKEELTNYLLSNFIKSIIPNTESYSDSKRNINIVKSKTNDKLASINTESHKITDCNNNVLLKILEDGLSNILTYFNNIDYNILLFLAKEYDFIGYRELNKYYLYKDGISFVIDLDTEQITIDPILLSSQNSLSGVSRSINNLLHTYKNYKK